MQLDRFMDDDTPHTDGPTPAWPPTDRGLLIGDAATLLGTTVKALRTYHDRGVVPEPDRDGARYRRYDARTLVLLGRVVRLRDVGLSLREIAAVLAAGDDGGAALRAALERQAGQIADELVELQRRRDVVGELLDRRLVDPLEVTAADVGEERQIAALRTAMPDLSAEHEALERRTYRALSSFGTLGDGVPDAADDALEAALLEVAGGPAGVADRSRRVFALRDAAVDDPRVEPLALEMRRVMEDTAAVALAQFADPSAFADAAASGPPVDPERFAAGLSAGLSTLPPAIRRVWEVTFGLMPAAADA
jgi:DNA-binding transcriptional MerR regulator